MAKINKLEARSYNGEVATVGVAIVKADEGRDWGTDTNMPTIITNIDNKETELSKALKRGRTMSNLEVKDGTRDEGLSSLYSLNNSYLQFPQPEIAAAAQTVQTVLDKYGLKITEDNYAQESSHIKSMLTDLSAPEIQTAIALLPGMELCITNLTTAENDFVTAFVEYKEAKAEAGEYASATELKKELLRLINDALVVYLRAMLVVSPDVYGNFATVVGQIIADNNEKVKRRKRQVSEEVPPDAKIPNTTDDETSAATPEGEHPA